MGREEHAPYPPNLGATPAIPRAPELKGGKHGV